MRVIGRHHNTPRSGRFGGMLVELVVSMIILGGVLTALVPALMSADQLRRTSTRKERAVQQLANVFEHVAALSYAEVSEESVRAAAERADVDAGLPEAVLDVTVDEETDPLPARRITLTLRWQDATSERGHSVSLTEWFYERGGGS